MSSDQNHLSRAQADLQARLREALPEDWQVIDVETLADFAFRKITLAYEQGDLTTEPFGTGLPRGVIGVEFALSLMVPEKPGPKGVARVSDAAYVLLSALDPMEDIYLTSGERFTTPSGETAYRFPVTFITQFITAPEEA